MNIAWYRCSLILSIEHQFHCREAMSLPQRNSRQPEIVVFGIGNFWNLRSARDVCNAPGVRPPLPA